MQACGPLIALGSKCRKYAPRTITLSTIAAGLFASGCATSDHVASAPPPAAGDKIAVSVGPCFGFCPVYTASIGPDGAVLFSGERNTEVLGTRERGAGAAAYHAFSDALAPFKPAAGTEAQVECAAAITDTSRYTIIWTAPDGQRTTATHQRGCAEGPGKALDALLATMPERLGIAAWAKQTTRPGASRG